MKTVLMALMIFVSAFASADWQKVEMLAASQKYEKAIAALKAIMAPAQVFESNNPDREYFVTNLFAQVKPYRMNACIQNPMTFKCDEGQDLEKIGNQFAEKYPHHGKVQEMLAFGNYYRQYRIQHEAIKLDEFILQYQVSLHPTGFDAFMMNTIYGNNRRTDGNVKANCVGPVDHGPVGKCDLVRPHALITRALNQAFYLEELQPTGEVLHKLIEVVVNGLTELREMVNAGPNLRDEVFPDYQRMDFDHVIAEYRARL